MLMNLRKSASKKAEKTKFLLHLLQLNYPSSKLCSCCLINGCSQRNHEMIQGVYTLQVSTLVA